MTCGFLGVELRGLEPLTPCLQSTARLSGTVAHLGLRLACVGRDRLLSGPVVVSFGGQLSPGVGPQHLIRRNLHALLGPVRTFANLRGHAHHLASFVAVERPRKAKVRPATDP